MSNFNLRKHAEKTKSRKPYEKMMIENNEEFGLEPADNRPYEKQLEDNRKPNKGDKNYEKMMDEVRTASPNTIIEKQMDKAKGKAGRNDDGIPLMDMGEKTSKAAEEEFAKKQNSEKKDKVFQETHKKDPVPKGGNPDTTIINNTQKSQVLSNYDSREEFEKNNKSASVESRIKDADALIYHTYRKAYSNARDITQQERRFIDTINKEKKSLLAEIK